MKHTKYKNFTKFSLSFLILAASMAVWGVVWMKSFAHIILRPFGYKGNWLMIVVYGIILMLFTSFYGGYKIGYQGAGDLFLSHVISLVLSNILTYLQTSLVGRALLSPKPFFLMTLVQILLVALWANGASRLFDKLFPPYRMLLLYGGREMARNLTEKMAARSNKYQIEEALCIEEISSDVIFSKIDGYEAVILCDIPTTQRNIYLKYCYGNSKRVYTTPKIPDILMRGAISHDLFDTPLLLNTSQVLTPEQKTIKRTIDLILSGIALLIASPFMLLLALAIKLYDGGPVIYKQKRLTLHGKVFHIYKFRSMIVDAEKESGVQLSSENDHRITPVGKFMRAMRLDELPQLWNIFKGDMSIVGPRPERPELTKAYLETMPEFDYRLKVKAGLTGYAQVYGKYNTTPYDKLKMDLMYLASYSLLLDFKIILLTVKILFKKESIEGVKDDNL